MFSGSDLLFICVRELYNKTMDQPDIFSLFPEKSEVISVAQLLEMINDLIQPLAVTVRGEVSSMQERPTAIYFSIADKEENAKLDCVLFRSNMEYYRSFVKEGADIEITGHPNIYKPFGKLSFIADQITPVGEGALKAAFEALKKQLENDGYFAPERKRDIPPYVENVGLITSAYGDAKKDFVTHIGEYGIKIHFKDARVEGAQAIPSIVKAIEYFNTCKTAIDALVVTRGGGSLESLQAFNSLEVAQAIYKSRIPVISAVGHENDVTIADLVADARASTPTHAGKMLSTHWSLAEDRVEEIDRSLNRSMQSATQRMENKFTQLGLRMVSAFTHSLQHKKLDLTLHSSSMLGHFRSVFTGFEKLEQSIQHAQSIFEFHLQKANLKVTTHEQLLKAVDPELKLKQGYSMTFTKDGKLLKDVSQVNKEEELVTHLGNGQVMSRVTEVK